MWILEKGDEYLCIAIEIINKQTLTYFWAISGLGVLCGVKHDRKKSGVDSCLMLTEEVG